MPLPIPHTNNSKEYDNHDPPSNTPRVSEEEKQTAKLQKLLEGTDEVLFKTTSVFPFDLFPDELAIDQHKVSIVFKEFFLSSDVHSIMIELIKDVEVETSALFGTLKLVPDGYPAQPICVKLLKKSDALKARRIIQGLMISKKAGLDVSKVKKEESKCDTLESIGKAQAGE